MKRVVIVGAGTGGLMVANMLAGRLAKERRLDTVQVTVVGDRANYLYQPGLLYLAFDLVAPGDLIRQVGDLIRPGVHFVHDRVRQVHPAEGTVETEGGQSLEYDYLVLATGSVVHPEEVPGLAEGGHAFYTLDGALRLRQALREFKGGQLLVTVGVPHKCPVAPLEFTFMFEDWARGRGIRKQTEILYTYPIGRAHSLESVGRWAEQEFAARGIQLETFFNLEAVDPEARTATSLEGSTVPYDLLVAVPPHIGDSLAAVSGLGAPGNWLPAHRGTLVHPEWPNIYTVGDATDLPVSKAGSTAHYQAEVVAENLMRQISGEPPALQYDGKAFCFIESGLDRATAIEFNYMRPPLVAPPTQAVHWFKQAYNRVHWLNLQAIV